MGMRYYHPSLMRWSKPDPVEQLTNPVQSMRFGYAGLNPIGMTDQLGARGAWVSGSAGPFSLGYSENNDGTRGGFDKGLGVGGLKPKRARIGFGFSGGAYTGTKGDQKSVGVRACAGVCLGVDTDKGLEFGVGPEVSIGVSLP